MILNSLLESAIDLYNLAFVMIRSIAWLLFDMLGFPIVFFI